MLDLASACRACAKRGTAPVTGFLALALLFETIGSRTAEGPTPAWEFNLIQQSVIPLLKRLAGDEPLRLEEIKHLLTESRLRDWV